MVEIAGESAAQNHTQAITSTFNRQQEIADLLGVGSQNSRSPVELFETYDESGMDDINIDTFRTTIWRMKGKTYTCGDREYEIDSADGRYWKKPAVVNESIEDLLR